MGVGAVQPTLGGASPATSLRQHQAPPPLAGRWLRERMRAKSEGSTVISISRIEHRRLLPNHRVMRRHNRKRGRFCHQPHTAAGRKQPRRIAILSTAERLSALRILRNGQRRDEHSELPALSSSATAATEVGGSAVASTAFGRLHLLVADISKTCSVVATLVIFPAVLVVPAGLPK